MEDQGIIALFFARSERAIEETDKKYGGYCYSIAYNILSNREDSEESVNDTYLAAWNTIPPRNPNFFNAFLAKITRYISIDRWRKNSTKRRDEIAAKFDLPAGMTPNALLAALRTVTDYSGYLAAVGREPDPDKQPD